MCNGKEKNTPPFRGSAGDAPGKAGREGAPAGAHGGCTPHSFSSCRKRMRRARWKKKALGRINLTHLCQVDRKTGVVVAGAAQTCGLVPSALYPCETEICFPAFGNAGLLSGWLTKGLSFWPRAFRFATRCRSLSPGGESKGEGPQPRPVVSLGGLGAKSKRPHVSGGGPRGRALFKRVLPLPPASPQQGRYHSQ